MMIETEVQQSIKVVMSKAEAEKVYNDLVDGIIAGKYSLSTMEMIDWIRRALKELPKTRG
jgi:hypothetical protein